MNLRMVSETATKIGYPIMNELIPLLRYLRVERW